MKCKYCNGTSKTYLIAIAKYDTCAWCDGDGEEEIIKNEIIWEPKNKVGELYSNEP